jgi:hypothetical protein
MSAGWRDACLAGGMTAKRIASGRWLGHFLQMMHISDRETLQSTGFDMTDELVEPELSSDNLLEKLLISVVELNPIARMPQKI